MSGEAAEVVLGCHDLSVRSGTTHGEQVSALHRRDAVSFDEDVAGFADGSYDVVGLLFVIGMADVLHAVEGAVKGRADEIGHAGIDDGEMLVLAPLDVEHPCDEIAALRHDGTSEFEMQVLVGSQADMLAPRREIRLEIGYGEMVGVLVEDAQTASDVDMLHRGAYGLPVGGCAGQLLHLLYQFVHTAAQLDERLHVGYLRTDMKMQTEEADSGQAVTTLYRFGQEPHGDAELVLAEAGGDLIVRMGVYIGIDAQAYLCDRPHGGRYLTDDFQFFHRLDVEAENALFEGITDLAVGLGDTCKNDLRCRKTRFDGRFDLSAAHAVGTQTALSYRADDGIGGAGLDRIMDMPVRVGGLGTQDIQRLAQDVHVVVIKGRIETAEMRYREGSCYHV